MPYDIDNITFSADGVKESNSTTKSLHVYSMKFKGCRIVYCIAIVRGSQGWAVDHKIMLKRVVDDIV